MPYCRQEQHRRSKSKRVNIVGEYVRTDSKAWLRLDFAFIVVACVVLLLPPLSSSVCTSSIDFTACHERSETREIPGPSWPAPSPQTSSAFNGSAPSKSRTCKPMAVWNYTIVTHVTQHLILFGGAAWVWGRECCFFGEFTSILFIEVPYKWHQSDACSVSSCADAFRVVVHMGCLIQYFIQLFDLS